MSVSNVSSEGVGFEIYEGFSFIFKGLIKAENFPQNIKIYGGISNLISSLMGSRFNLSVTTSGYIKTKVFLQLHSEVVQVSRFSK